MPRDVSSSSSEDEADNPTAEPSLGQKESEKSSKYQCPDDFVSFDHQPCRSTLTERLKRKKSELWLIKAPANFDPRCLQGASVNLSGFQTLKLPSAADAGERHGQHVYNILASSHCTNDLRLLTADSSSPAVGPAFSGILSVSESYEGVQMPPCVVHASPAPAIPDGLKQRFQPFGSKTPTTSQERQVEDGKRKKKKKKDRKIKIEEQEEELMIKQEVEEPAQEHTEGKSRKRRKKDTEEVAIAEVKSEVDVDALYKEDGLAKKKKKKKKSKTSDD
ncbi:CD3e molecule, epsilon associated protein [Syngnathus typhle]|uniref:CD3e molecule, epsilon associated protein n=1 Tax=Syngnathus typhle TaxID=161592 RepID=UPI002A69DB1F|nr:CD3e molecule, epsilon associated protein [Syngnathus typhle]